MTFICRPTSVDIWYIHWVFKQKKKKREKKFIVNTRYLRRGRWYFRGVLNDSFFLYIYIWNFSWINIWRIEETTKYCKWNWGICYYCYYYLFIDALWDPALCCDDFVCEFEFLLYWLLHTYNSQFVLMCFLCTYTYSTSLMYAAFINFSEVFSCVCYSACFHTISLYALFSGPCLPFYYSSQTEDPLVFCLPIVWRGARSPSHTIEVLTTCLLHLFYICLLHYIFFIYYLFCILFYFK